MKVFTFLSQGLGITVAVTAGAAALGLIVAFTAGLLRLSRRRMLNAPALIYIETFRGTSALVQLFWAYYALPLLGLRLDAMTASILVLGLNAGAYGAEVVRGAILAVPRAQYDAALALGMSGRQRMRYAILPQALPAMIPPFGNLVIELMKNTALCSLVTLSELTFRAQLLRADTLNTTQVFGALLILYLGVAGLITFGVRVIERRVGRGLARGGLA